LGCTASAQSGVGKYGGIETDLARISRLVNLAIAQVNFYILAASLDKGFPEYAKNA
jgi:hypothetical protein